MAQNHCMCLRVSSQVSSRRRRRAYMNVNGSLGHEHRPHSIRGASKLYSEVHSAGSQATFTQSGSYLKKQHWWTAKPWGGEHPIDAVTVSEDSGLLVCSNYVPYCVVLQDNIRDLGQNSFIKTTSQHIFLLSYFAVFSWNFTFIIFC